MHTYINLRLKATGFLSAHDLLLPPDSKGLKEIIETQLLAHEVFPFRQKLKSNSLSVARFLIRSFKQGTKCGASDPLVFVMQI